MPCTTPGALLRQGDVVFDGDISVVVPAIRQGVTATADGPTGSESLDIENLGGAVGVVVSDCGPEEDHTDDPINAVGQNTDLPESDTATALVGVPPALSDFYEKQACEQKGYYLKNWAWNSTVNWYYNYSSAPSEINRDNAEAAMRAAISNITQAHTNCSRADNISATSAYQGRLNADPNIAANSTCGQPSWDGYSVVGFGDLRGYAGYSCTRRQVTIWGDRIAIETDIKLSKSSTWVVYPGEDCVGKEVVEDLVTHEFGHSFGLGHPEKNNYALTMFPGSRYCQKHRTTLGLGDLLGLEQKY